MMFLKQLSLITSVLELQSENIVLNKYLASHNLGHS